MCLTTSEVVFGVIYINKAELISKVCRKVRDLQRTDYHDFEFINYIIQPKLNSKSINHVENAKDSSDCLFFFFL